MEVDGTPILINTVWDGLCLLYTMNFKLPPNSPKSLKKKTEFLLLHLNQLVDWITLLESTGKSNHIPTTVNVSWKTWHRRIVKVAFGTTTVGTEGDRSFIVRNRQRSDLQNLRLFPRDEKGNLNQPLMKWPPGNCAESNPWTHLLYWRPELQIRTLTIQSRSRKEILPCLNCQAVIDYHNQKTCPAFFVSSKKNSFDFSVT